MAWLVRDLTAKPVRTIIYTHGHPDHRGGAGAFIDTNPEIIAFAPVRPPLKKTEMLADVQALRGSRQFGYALTDEENISQGIGIREGIAHGERRAFVPPTQVYAEDRVIRDIDGVRLEMFRLPGETDDQIMIWLPEHEALCCGDNYYGCWPNLYAIRGSQYRDVAAWADSLGVLVSCSAEHLLPGHTRPVSGKENVRNVLTAYRDAFLYVLETTLSGMNEGKDMDTLASEVRLPERLASLPYLGEYYGCVEWTVRAIFTAYLGWFDGNPAALHPLPPAERAVKTIALMGGARAASSRRRKTPESRVTANGAWNCAIFCSGPGRKRTRPAGTSAPPSSGWPPAKPAPTEGITISPAPASWRSPKRSRHSIEGSAMSRPPGFAATGGRNGAAKVFVFSIQTYCGNYETEYIK